MLTDQEFLKELSEETLSFHDHSNMYFHLQLPCDSFTEFTYNDKVVSNFQSSDSKFYSSDDFLKNFEDVHYNDLEIISMNMHKF